MKIKKGKGKPGVEINLTGSELWAAIQAYLVAHKITVVGPQTVRIDRELAVHRSASVSVDPSGCVIDRRNDDEIVYEGNPQHNLMNIIKTIKLVDKV